MSNSLRERLKRSSRYYSPQAPKRQCAENTTVMDPDNSHSSPEDSQQDQNQPLDKIDINCTEIIMDDDSSQDFEYSDDDEIESSCTDNPEPIKTLNFGNVSPPKASAGGISQTIPKEQVVPKFSRKRVKRPFQAYMEETSEDTSAVLQSENIKDEKMANEIKTPMFKRTQVKSKSKSNEDTVSEGLGKNECLETVEIPSEDKDSELTSKSTEDEEISKEVKIPTFKRTPIKSKPKLKEDEKSENLKYPPKISDSLPQTKTSTVTSSDSALVENVDWYEEEKTEIFTSKQLDSMTVAELTTLRHSIQEKQEKKEETLRKLKMVKMYRSKVSTVNFDTVDLSEIKIRLQPVLTRWKFEPGF